MRQDKQVIVRSKRVSRHIKSLIPKRYRFGAVGISFIVLFLLYGTVPFGDFSYFTPQNPATGSIDASTSQSALYRVTSVIDGDTIKVDVDGAIETIRFIGIDTPETKDPRKPVQCYGRESSSRMQHYAQSKNVRLELDETQGDRDKYDRLLRYVYTEDGTNINQAMIAEGFAHEYTYDKPYKYQTDFKAAQQDAKNKQIGFWAISTCEGDTSKSV